MIVIQLILFFFCPLGDIDEDSDLEEAELEKVVSKVQKKGGKLRSKVKSKVNFFF